MKYLLNILFLLALPQLFAQKITHQYHHKNIYYKGRFDLNNDSAAVCSYPGSQIDFEVKTKKLVLHLDQSTDLWSNNLLTILLDGTFYKSINLKDSSTITIFSYTKKKTHTVSIIKASEPWMGLVGFKGISIKGKLMKQEQVQKPKLLFIGASWETGFGNMAIFDLKQTDTLPWASAQTNHYYAYPAITSRVLNADYQCICFGGKGLVRAWDGDTTNQLPSLFTKTTSIDSPNSYRFSDFVPDIVYTNLSINDFNQGVPDSLLYTKKYLNFVMQIHALYPNAKIVLGDQNMSTNTYYQPKIEVESKYHQAVVAAAYVLGVKDIYYYRFDENHVQTWGATWHPNRISHARKAAELSTYLRKLIEK